MAVRASNRTIINQRLGFMILVFGMSSVILSARLVYLQAIKGRYWRTQAVEMRGRVIPLPAQRGAILDRFGRPMAETIQQYAMVCDPTRIKDASQTASVVSSILNIPAEQLYPLLDGQDIPKGSVKRNVLLDPSLMPDMITRWNAAKQSSKTRPLLDGLYLVDNAKRIYPLGRDACQLIGITNANDKGDFFGCMGLEFSRNSVLSGKDGSEYAQLDAGRHIIPGTQEHKIDPVNGLTIRLTIDSNIQNIAETELLACFKKHKPVGATAIVMDPKTGDILANVSLPNFDPMNRATLKPPYSSTRNRALMRIEPGSTFKLITASAALSEHVVTPETTFNCPESIKIGGHVIHDVIDNPSKVHGPRVMNIKQIITVSSNVGMAQVGVRLGFPKLIKYIKAFGLLDKSDIGLPGEEQGTLGFSKWDRKKTKAKLARVSFGQSVMVTPLRLAAAYCAIANHGVLMRPRLIMDYQDSHGVIVRNFPPQEICQVISPSTSEELTNALINVVQNGTGKGVANVPGYTVAGKTGTAQMVIPGIRGYAPGKYNASFIGFLPAHNPRALIYVVVSQPKNGYYGAEVAAPVFQAIARRLMWYWKVPPDDPASLQNTKVVATNE